MFKGFYFFLKMSMRYDKKYFVYMVLNQLILFIGTIATIILPRYLINEILGNEKNINSIVLLIILATGVPFLTTTLNSVFENHIFLHRINVYNKFNQFMSEGLMTSC